MDDAQAARDEVVEAMARAAEVYGLNRSYGRLYGLLFFAGEAQSLDDLVAESGYAKSTVSTAMQALERYHLVHRTSVPGEGRKAYFEAERDWWQVMEDLVEHQVRQELRLVRRALDDAEERLEGVEGERASRYRERVRRLQRTYDQFEVLVDLFARAPTDRLLSIASSVLGRDADDDNS